MSKQENLEKIRHSTSHVLAAVVLDMFPEAKPGIGPNIKNGFYYDFELPRTLIPEDLEILEGKMQDFIKKAYSFEQYDEPKDKAIEFLKKAKQTYKIELVQDILGDKVSFYKTGPFVDLCQGPHVKNTSEIKAFKLLSIAGAYWKGNEANTQLQRIYGTAFNNKKELEDFLKNQEKIKGIDHKKIGQKLGIFIQSSEVGVGLPIWMPKGETLRTQIENIVMCECLKDGYMFIRTPHIAKSDLYKTSGHLRHYKKDMFPEMDLDGEKYVLRPMNCPHHAQVYMAEQHSYKDLPYRLAEFGMVYRREKSGEVSGLARPRGFTIDDGHIFCAPGQVEHQFIQTIKLQQRVLKKLGFDKFKIILSLRGKDNKKNYIGTDEMWKKAEDLLRGVLKKANMSFEEKLGEAAFYGPKADFFIEDAYSREWQLSTIQVDFNIPERFDLNYIDKDGKKQRVVMIHRAIIGSFERFMAIFLEHTKGALPFDLAPVQVQIITISDKFNSYAEKIKDKLRSENIRVVSDNSANTMGKKIREAELLKIPYMLIIGEREQKAQNIAVREFGKGDLGSKTVDEFLKSLG
ncbi:threonine--tRNA ligase [Patescibacteria group bacterium]